MSVLINYAVWLLLLVVALWLKPVRPASCAGCD